MASEWTVIAFSVINTLGVLSVSAFVGLVASTLAYPASEGISRSQRLFLSLLFAVGSQVLLGSVLALVHQYHGIGMVVGEGVLLIGAIAACYRARRRPDGGLDSWRKYWTTGSDAYAALLVLGFYGLFYAAYVVWCWQGSTVVGWYYLTDILLLVSEQSVPEFRFEWGQEMSFEINKLGWYLPVGILATAAKASTYPIVFQHIVSFLTSMGTVLGFWVGARVFSKRTLTVVLCVLVILLLPRTVYKMTGLRGEAYGLMMMPGLMWLSFHCFETRKWRYYLTLGLGAGLLAASHMVPAVILALWHTSLFAEALVRGPARRRLIVHNGILAVMAFSLLQGMALLGGGAALGDQQGLFENPEVTEAEDIDPTKQFITLISSDPGFRGNTGRRPKHLHRMFADHPRLTAMTARWMRLPTPFFGLEDGLGPIIESGAEAHRRVMWQKVLGITLLLLMGTKIQRNLILLGIVYGAIWWKWSYIWSALFGPNLGYLFARYSEILPMVCITLLVMTGGAWYRRRAFYIWAVGAMIYCMGLAFSYRYDTYLPAMHPPRREFPYIQILCVFLFGMLFDQLLTRASERFGEKVARFLGLAFIVSMVAPPAYADAMELKTLGQVEQADHILGISALQWVGSNVASNSRIMTDGSSDGVCSLLSGSRCLVEGRAPYFQPRNMDQALYILGKTHEYFRTSDPAILDELEVDYVIAGAESYGARKMFRPKTWEPLPAHLRLIKQMGRFRIYEVLRD